MENTNIIYNNEKVRNRIKKIEELEKTRIYCKHNMYHFLSVARICYILCLEKELQISKDVIYSAALLHDLGRVEEIEKGISHEKASFEFAKEILEITKFSEKEKQQVLSAIINHRKKSDEISFEALFYKSDKLSRECYMCRAYDLCNWSKEKKNNIINY